MMSRKVQVLDHFCSLYISMTLIALLSSVEFIILRMALNLVQFSKSINKLNKYINVDKENLTNWLNANKISLNVKKLN